MLCLQGTLEFGCKVDGCSVSGICSRKCANQTRYDAMRSTFFGSWEGRRIEGRDTVGNSSHLTSATQRSPRAEASGGGYEHEHDRRVRGWDE